MHLAIAIAYISISAVISAVATFATARNPRATTFDAISDGLAAAVLWPAGLVVAPWWLIAKAAKYRH